MPMYRVKLGATAYMSQEVEVEADSREEAEEAAIADTGSRAWDYDGIVGEDDQDGGVTVTECEVLPEPQRVSARLLIPDPYEPAPNPGNIKPGEHDLVLLLREHAGDQDAVLFIADMLELQQ